jgi:hypothetical protein
MSPLRAVTRRSFLAGGGAVALSGATAAAAAGNVVAAAGQGTVALDSFAGATDDAKLTAALAYLAAQSAKPTLLFPWRDTTFTQPGRPPFSGLRIDFGAPRGPLTLEIPGTIPFRVHVNTGGPWWDSTAVNLQTCWFGNLAAQYGGGSWFWRNNYATGGTAPYPVEFEHMGHFGGAGVFGTSAEKCVLTQAVFSGHWATMAFTDTPYHLGGADMDLWPAGMHNIESQRAGSKPIIWVDDLSNSNLGPVYITSPEGWRGIQVDGDVAETKGCALTIHGGTRIEGHQASLPAYGTLLRVRGGQVSVRDAKVAWAMTQPDADEHAPIQVEGGDVSLDGLFYDQSTWAGPMAECSGGILRVSNAKSITGDPMVVRNAGGTVTTDSSVVVQ